MVILDERTGLREKYELLEIIEFTSTRKRMSVLVRTPDDRILCMTKGADSIIIPRLREGQEDLVKATLAHLDECANEGLRTLILAQKEVDPVEYAAWSEKYRLAQA